MAKTHTEDEPVRLKDNESKPYQLHMTKVISGLSAYSPKQRKEGLDLDHWMLNVQVAKAWYRKRFQPVGMEVVR